MIMIWKIAVSNCCQKSYYRCCSIKENLKSLIFVRTLTTGKCQNKATSVSKVSHSGKGNAHRYNLLGLQMLPPSLHKEIFKENYLNGKVETAVNERLNESIAHLSKFDLWGMEPETLPDTHIEMPKLSGNNINEHFENIARDQAEVYATGLHNLLTNQIPSMPKEGEWLRKPGWTEYVNNGDGTFDITPVEYPDDSALVFDCEVLSGHSDIPIMATAVSSRAWYSWVSERFFQKESKLENNLQSLIPMEPTNDAISNPSQTPAKLIVGHNVGYDRARIREQYFPLTTNVRFLDTMSMHISVSGFNGQQRQMCRSPLTNVEENDMKAVLKNSWLEAGSLNNLSDVHKLYCGKPLDKSKRDIFVSGTMSDVQANFSELMNYCASDVLATYNVLAKLTPLFFFRFPHPVTFAGLLEMGLMYLPVNNNWNRYVKSCEDEYESLNMELKSHLSSLMDDACHLMHNNAFAEDRWLWDSNWSAQSIKLLKSPRKGFKTESWKPKKKLVQFLKNSYKFSAFELAQLGKSIDDISNVNEKVLVLFKKLLQTADRLPKVRTHMPGSPKWYSELCVRENDPDWRLDAKKLSTLTRITPKLLRLTWLGYPLHHETKHGWGYLVSQAEEKLNQNEILDPVKDEIALEEIDEGIVKHSRVGVTHTPAEDVEGLRDNDIFHRLPHKNGVGKNVGSPLSQDFLTHIEAGLLSSADSTSALRCLEINKMCSYWRSNKNRVLEQMRIGLSDNVLPSTITEDSGYSTDLDCGAIIPQVAVCGTVSRRAVERTWLTASNIQSDRVGSELKSMVQAPPGYKFVGADVDSQELWIASLFGDASFIKEHGCTALSWMTLRGNKREGTDLHSKTAKTIGMSRNEAKVFNYARMYGAGKQSALQAFMQHNKTMPKAECMNKIYSLYNMTKGHLLYKLSEDALWFVKKTRVSISSTSKLTGYATFAEVNKIKEAATQSFGQIRVINKNDLICGKKWSGGIESHMFNKLEEIATSNCPETPVLHCKISRALLPSKVHGDFLPGRMNWVVQSSAVDYLHLLLVSMRWLIKKYNLDARFLISIHDEVRYMASAKDSYLIALALNISNLLTRSMFAYQLGMHDLPLCVAFFSSVEVDQVIRKESTDDCITPSNQSGLQTKYGISLGEALDINDILGKTSGGRFAKKCE